MARIVDLAATAPTSRSPALAPSYPPDEAALIEALLSHLSDDLLGKTQAIRREVGVGRSIADVVCLGSAPRNRGRGVSVPQALSILESVVLARLRRKGPTRIDVLEQRCGLQRTALRARALERLLAWGLVERSNGGRVSAARPWASLFRVVAIEAKLIRWRDALRQAEAYLRYADEAYVALPWAVATRALRASSEFERQGVGLLLVGRQRSQIAIEARPSAQHDWRREFVLSRLAMAG